jgi:hypothetical protein
VVAKYVERLVGGYGVGGHGAREYDNGGGGAERSEGVR